MADVAGTGVEMGQTRTVLPWRYFVPRRGYGRALRLAKACPELRPFIDREAFLKSVEAVSIIPQIVILAIAAPLILVGMVGFVLTQIMPRSTGIRDKINENAEAANRLVPPDEACRRIGEELR